MNDRTSNDTLDDLAHKAAGDLRRSAPIDGLRQLEHRRRVRAAQRTVVKIGVVVVVGGAGLVAWAARPDPSPPATAVSTTLAATPTTAPTTSTTASPSTTVPAASFVFNDTGPAAITAADPAPDAERDLRVANASVLTASDLGAGWTLFFGPTDVAAQYDADKEAAKQQRCAALLATGASYSFAGSVPSPIVEYLTGRNTVISQRSYVFPTAAAASRQMDIIATQEFQQCDEAVGDTVSPLIDTSVSKATSTPATGPLLAPHGDRTISLAVDTNLSKVGGRDLLFEGETMWVQVGRIIVAVNCDRLPPDATFPKGLAEFALDVTTAKATAALATN